ncbi:MAG: exodeoxyribonuclease VII small subunit [Alphaproteobacteria bacterium]|nr:exodeoxyribonuclease VII small subunit [Alphaproteobacteria bacterium]
MSEKLKKQIAKMSFEAAMERLEHIVETLSSQKVNLNSMIALHEEGSLLKEFCEEKLAEAKMKIEVISLKKSLPNEASS